MARYYKENVLNRRLLHKCKENLVTPMSGVV
jgi:hypothetical protein